MVVQDRRLSHVRERSGVRRCQLPTRATRTARRRKRSGVLLTANWRPCRGSVAWRDECGAPRRRKARRDSMSSVTYQKVDVDGIGVFYREAGRREAPTILLLHGFPTASHMFRDLIPELAHQFRLV